MTRKSAFKISVFVMAVSFFVAGCATTRARKPEPTVDQSAQNADLQKQLQEKDQQIQDLQYQLTNSQQSISSSNFAASSSKSDKSSIVRVPGVTVTDVQKALVRAGYDPGPVDGHAGKKTKAAIKKFQRRNNLAADGVVGEKTWNKLK